MAFDAMALNGTNPSNGPEFTFGRAWKLPPWGEPLLVLSILVASMVCTRRKGFPLFVEKPLDRQGLLSTDDLDAARSSDDLLSRDFMIRRAAAADEEDDSVISEAVLSYFSTNKFPPKKRRCCGLVFYTPNSSRFADNPHARLLQKFPFAIEMFYWVVTLGFYQSAKLMTQVLFSETEIIDVAQDHGLAILNFEQYSWMSFLFPIQELTVQQWFLNGHQTFLTVLNRSYALIHIPGTVGFIAWYYYVAPSFNTFSIVRRTLTLTNFLAFAIFVVFPTMPPRLLPQEYGFNDSVHHEEAQSVWMSGKYVMSLAAMPSMHFGYAFCIGCTMVWHSGVLRRRLEFGEVRKPLGWKCFYVLLGIAYPSWILVTIVATANHYYLDACVAVAVAAMAFAFNRVFLVFVPIEDLILWCLRLEKPVPTTGERFHQRGGRL